MLPGENDQKLKEIVELYGIVKERIIYCEEIDPESKTNIQFINELRNSFDHLMRVFSVYYEIKTTEETNYLENNLAKAFGHIYRVGYDVLDWTSLKIREKISLELAGFSNDAITTSIPTYYSKIKPDIENICEEIADLRNKKDVTDANMDNFMAYIEKTKRLQKYYEQVLTNKAALVEYQKKQTLSKAWSLLKDAGLVLLGALLTAALT